MSEITAQQTAQEIVAHFNDDEWGARELTSAIASALEAVRQQALQDAEAICRTRAAEYTSYRGNQKREAEGCAKAISVLTRKDAK